MTPIYFVSMYGGECVDFRMVRIVPRVDDKISMNGMTYTVHKVLIDVDNDTIVVTIKNGERNKNG